MIRFNVENVFTQAIGSQPHEISALYDCLSYRIPNADIIRRKKLRMEPGNSYWQNWTGTKSFFIKDQGTFLTGLLPKVQMYCNSVGIKIEIVDKRVDPATSPADIHADMLEGISMSGVYDYQLRAVKEICRYGRGVIQLPTGAGKTEISVAVTKALNVPTLFLTHRVNLLHQTAERYKDRCPELADKIGIIGSGKIEPNFITLATVQTLQSMKKRHPKEYIKLLSGFANLIIDEAHRSGAKQFYEPALFCKNAFYRLLLTATPFMKGNAADNMYLMGIGGPVASRVSNKELIDAGVLARPFFKFFQIDEPDVSSFEDWPSIYERGIVQHNARNSFIAQQAANLANDGKKILIIVNQIAHGKILLNLLKKANVSAKYVDGGVKYSEREKALKWLADKGNVMIATNIFDEGIDVKSINVVILAAGNKSAPALFQRTGRATRKKKSDNYAIIVDFIDKHHPKLLAHSMQRYNLIKNEKGFTIL